MVFEVVDKALAERALQVLLVSVPLEDIFMEFQSIIDWTDNKQAS